MASIIPADMVAATLQVVCYFFTVLAAFTSVFVLRP
jgi:hypothetical protein